MTATSRQPDQRSGPSAAGGRRARIRVTCRRYTSALLVVVGVVVALVLALLDVWWGLIVGVFIAFLFGALLARPWCVGADGVPGEREAGLRSARRS